MRLIKIDDVIKKLNDAERRMAMRGYYRISLEIRSICSAIKRLPTIDAEPVRHGKWETVCEIKYKYETEVEEKCSLCGRHVFRYKTQTKDDYCPTCGAKMDKEDSNARNHK
jgi:predicted RNA-binding Zn-ribbon protein involved in translation (DUF1610 family)